MRVLVTGGAGYIGSHAVRELLNAGHKVVVLDNLSKGHMEAVDPRAQLVVGSTASEDLLIQRLKAHQIEAVMHFAADIEVGESVTNPHKYYQNNFANSLNLLRAMVETGVKKLVFSSTAAVYGNPESTPIQEYATRSPINPYGRSKYVTELAIEDFCLAHRLGYTIMRYFNVAGAHPDADIGEDHQPESHLIPRILTGARSDGEVKIFGTDYDTHDGTCVRDYVHVVDLVRAHVLALEAMEEGQGQVFNVGSESGFTVREVIAACERVTGKKLRVKEEGRRAGDPATLVASSQKLRTILGWEPLYPDMETIVSHAWKWHTTYPNGYSDQTTSEQRRAPLATVSDTSLRS